MTQPLANQIALVTGASRGIGRAIARRLAAEGAHVLVHYANSRVAADSLVAEIEAAGGNAETIGADLSTAEGPGQLVERTKAILGNRKLDILFNNAGIAEFALFEDTTPQLLDRHLTVNVRSPYLVASGLSDVLAEDARVVFTSSVAARIGVAAATAYSQTKGALNTLVRGLAAAWGPRGIRVNALSPGAIKSDMSDVLIFGSEESTAAILETQALKRVGLPEDIAGAAAFLAGPDSKWVTGQVLEVSGGANL